MEARDNPDVMMPIVVDPDAIFRESILQLSLQLLRGAQGNFAAHQLQVKHVGIFLKRNPQAMEIIFGNASAGIAVQGVIRIAYTIIYICGTVVANESASMRGYPDETMTILENIIHKIAWQAILQIQMSGIKFLRE